MRSNASYLLAVFALLGCYSIELPPELPEPDLTKQVYVLMEGAGAFKQCEAFSAELVWEGYFEAEGFSAEDKCEPCECTPAECELPSKVTASASVCSREDAVGTLEAGASWDGSCSAAEEPIPGDAVATVTFEPSTLAPCAPVSPVPKPSMGSLRFIRACKSDPPGYAPTLSVTCYPPQENGECWKGYDRKFEYPMLNDTRQCSPCSCGAPSGGNCTAEVMLYQDPDCVSEVVAEYTTNHSPPVCTRATSARLAAMRSVFLFNEPGTCAPSTDSEIVSGSLERGVTHVLCCDR
ncbi:hypothetical protein WMF45_25275 [Sorangium sp. So ce448]|uniref:hypothetical protein n=1 Tax=Sorangium sp. So ce448 TaxID=3133314 RepID=UPI003F646741